MAKRGQKSHTQSGRNQKNLLSPTGAVLAVTIVYSKLSTLQMQSGWLERILLDGAKL